MISASAGSISIKDIPCQHLRPEAPAVVYNRIMTVKVTEGTTSKEFLTYHGLICFHSGFFDRMLNSFFVEGGSNVHEMTDCKIDTFQMFYNWMNTDVATLIHPDAGASEEYLQAVELYLFTDFYDVPALKDRALELYFATDCKHWAINDRSIPEIYEVIPENDRMRKLAVDIVVDYAGFKCFDDQVSGAWGWEFARDIIKTSRKKNVVPGWGGVGITQSVWKNQMMEGFCERYHVHAASEEIPRITDGSAMEED